VSSSTQASRGQFKPMLRAAAGCWHAARGFAEHRALAAYIARRALGRAGLGFDRRQERTIRLGGLELHLRPGSGELFLYQEIFRDLAYERHPAFAPRTGWNVLDCGANIGMFSLRAARAGCAQILALEPDPETFGRLALNLERNGATAVIPLRLAAGHATCRAAFERNAVSTLGQLVSSDHREASASSRIVVEVTTLACLFDRYSLGNVHLLKLDVEGAECDVLEGARPVLGRIERIVMEYHGAERLAGCERLLRQYGFARVAIATPAYAYFARGWVS
jgi:FkbM family methyltransferase